MASAEHLTSRQLHVLEAVIQTYIETAEPAGSRTVSQRFGLGVSSATVRNIMAELEEQGLLYHPHTSAGRIPTDLAYRVYVDSLMHLSPPSDEARQTLQAELPGSRNAMDQLLRRTAQVLGVLTQVVNEEWKVFVNNRQMGVVTEVFRGGWIADYADPATFLELFVGGSNLNHTFYDNPAFDQVIEAARLSQGAARMNLLQEAERMLLQDMPVIPLYYYVSRHLVDTKVTGFADNVRDIHLSRYLALEPESP